MAELWCGSHHFLASIVSTISQIQVFDYFIIVCHNHIMVDYAQFHHIIKVVILECHNSEVNLTWEWPTRDLSKESPKATHFGLILLNSGGRFLLQI